MNKKYIYNVAQANFYMSLGVTCLGTGIHRKTNNPFWIFGEQDSAEAYRIWCERDRGDRYVRNP